MLEGVANVAWHIYAQPPDNPKGELPAALISLASASPTTGANAYNRMLYAVGNNHAGTYYPVVLLVIPFLGEIMEQGGNDARMRALDVLIDLLGSFDPEPGHEIVETTSGAQPLKEALRAEAAKLASIAKAISESAALADERALARDVLALIRET